MSNYGLNGWFFKSKHIGQYLPVGSVLAHSSHNSFPHCSQSWSPVVSFPQSSHGCSTISMVTVALALWLTSIPMAFAKSARFNSLASNHSIVVSFIVMILQPKITVAETFFFLSFNIINPTPNKVISTMPSLFILLSVSKWTKNDKK